MTFCLCIYVVTIFLWMHLSINISFPEREEGDLGPIHGFQWRHYGARLVGCLLACIYLSRLLYFSFWSKLNGFQSYRYTNMHVDYTGQGFDQLSDVIHKIKARPDDRRIILSSWNPSDLKLMALPPCRIFAQVLSRNFFRNSSVVPMFTA